MIESIFMLTFAFLGFLFFRLVILTLNNWRSFPVQFKFLFGTILSLPVLLVVFYIVRLTQIVGIEQAVSILALWIIVGLLPMIAFGYFIYQCVKGFIVLNETISKTE